MRLRSLAVTLFCASLGSGCASIVDGTMENSNYVTFSSEPTGAKIMSGDRVICSTPCRDRIPAFEMDKLIAVLDGHKPVKIEEHAGINLNVLGNAIVGGGVGLFVDALTGRAVRHQDTVHIIFGE